MRCRYLAAKHGWYDSLTAAEAARVDMAAEGTEDVRKQLTAVKYSDDYTEDEKRQKYADWCAVGKQAAERRWGGRDRCCRREREGAGGRRERRVQRGGGIWLLLSCYRLVAARRTGAR